MAKPYLIVVTGRPGSGKTTFSAELGKRMSLPVISRDEIKEGYVQTFGKSHSELPKDTNKIVTDLFFETVTLLLLANVSLIAEAAFQHSVWESRLTPLKDKARMFMLICKVKDDRIVLERFIKRGLDNPLREYFHGDQINLNGKEAELSPYIEPRLDVPTIYIDTTDGYNPSIEELKTIILSKKGIE